MKVRFSRFGPERQPYSCLPPVLFQPMTAENVSRPLPGRGFICGMRKRAEEIVVQSGHELPRLGAQVQGIVPVPSRLPLAWV